MEILRATARGEVFLHGGRGGAWSFYVADQPKTAAVDRLVSRGWIVLPDYPSNPAASAVVALSESGQAVLVP